MALQNVLVVISQKTETSLFTSNNFKIDYGAVIKKTQSTNSISITFWLNVEVND